LLQLEKETYDTSAEPERQIRPFLGSKDQLLVVAMIAVDVLSMLAVGLSPALSTLFAPWQQVLQHTERCTRY
jgi:hypothetical protein